MNSTSRNPLRPLFLLWAGWLGAGAAVGAVFAEDGSPPAVTTPPENVVEALSLPAFYRKHVDVEGFSIVGSERVSDFALLEAAYLIRKMAGHRPDLLRELAKNKVRFTIMAFDEMTTDVPEHSDLRPRKYWDRRARGLGASRERPSVSCGEENLLAFPGDPYSTENILIHEFAHALHLLALNSLDDTFDARLKIVYEAAISGGLWENKYAATNKEEYWAEGVQSWFDTNRENDRDHNHVDTREELKEYDPRLAALVQDVFGDTPWRYVSVTRRSQEPHLRAFDPATSPKFVWPDGLAEMIDRLWQAGRGELQLADDDPVWVNASGLDPASLPEAKSTAGGPATSIVFVNSRPQPVNLHWVDFDGKHRDDGRIAPGRFRLVNTFRDHLWLITDLSGRPIVGFRSLVHGERGIIPRDIADDASGTDRP